MGCTGLNALNPVCQAKSAVSSLTGSAVDQFVQALADGCKEALGYVASFWMKVPSPTVAHGSGQSWVGDAAITSLQGNLAPFAGMIAVISFAFALTRIAFAPDRASDGLRGIGRQMFAVLLAFLPTLAVTELLIQAGDEFSPWIIQQASGSDASSGFKDVLIGGIFPQGADYSNGLGLFLVLFLLAIIGSIVQCIFMVVRGAALFTLLAFVPIAAAGAASEEGWARFKRIFMVIVGFALYKPVAAIIYAVGLKLMSDSSSTDQVQNALYGLTVIAMAALALPAFIKFVMPAAAAGSSGVFSGGAALGAVAAGAAVVSLGGGAAAAGAGRVAAGAAGSGGTAAAGAATEATVAGGAASSGGPTAGGASGGSGGGPGGAPSGGGAPAGGPGGASGAVPSDGGAAAAGSSTSEGAASSGPPARSTSGAAPGAAASASAGGSSTSADGVAAAAAPSGGAASAGPASAPSGAGSRGGSQVGALTREVTRDATQRVQQAGSESAGGAEGAEQS